MQFVVIEGLDGSGKSTQVKRVREHLEKTGQKHKFIHFPRTDTPYYGEMVARFLRGEFGPNELVDPYLVAMLYAGDRAAAAIQIRQWISEGYFILMDRYVYSNIAFQCAKLDSMEEKIKLKDWIFDLEFTHHAIPRPDLSLFLDVPFAFTKSSLSNNREGQDRDYLKGSRDIHEENLGFQEKVRDIYKWQVREQNDFTPINCMDSENKMLPPQVIFEKILDRLTKKK